VKKALISIKVPEGVVDLIDDLVRMKLYRNRSEVVRKAIWDLLKKEHPKLGANPLVKSEEEGL